MGLSRHGPALNSPPPARPSTSGDSSNYLKRLDGYDPEHEAGRNEDGDGWVINSLKARIFSLEEQARQMGGGKVLADFRELQRETQRENQILREALARAQAEGDALRNRLAAHEARLQALEQIIVPEDDALGVGHGHVGRPLFSRTEGVESVRAQLVEVEEGLLQHLRNVAARFQSLDEALQELRALSRRNIADVETRLVATDDRLSLVTQQQKLVVLGIQNQLQVDLQPFIESAVAELSLAKRSGEIGGRHIVRSPPTRQNFGSDREDANDYPLNHRSAYKHRLRATEESMNALQQRISTLHNAARHFDSGDQRTPVRSPM